MAERRWYMRTILPDGTEELSKNYFTQGDAESIGKTLDSLNILAKRPLAFKVRMEQWCDRCIRRTR